MTWTSEIGRDSKQHSDRAAAVDYVKRKTHGAAIRDHARRVGVVVNYGADNMPRATIRIENGVVVKTADRDPIKRAQANFDAANAAYRDDPSPTNERALRNARFELKMVKQQ